MKLEIEVSSCLNCPFDRTTIVHWTSTDKIKTTHYRGCSLTIKIKESDMSDEKIPDKCPILRPTEFWHKIKKL